jgi:hypothetical protein
MDDPIRKITLRVVYVDEHLVQLECQALLGTWSGVAQAYTTQREVREFGTELEQFSATLQGQATWECGDDNGIGLIGLRLYTIDRACHVACQVRLAKATATVHRPGEIWRLSAEMGTEAGQVARFAQQLAKLAERESGEAILAGLVD